MADPDGFQNFDFDPRSQQYHYVQRLSWPLHGTADASSSSMATPSLVKRSSSPLPMTSAPPQTFTQPAAFTTAELLSDWQQMTSQAPPSATFALDTTFPAAAAAAYDTCGMPFHASPTDYLPPQPSLDASVDVGLSSAMPLGPQYVGMHAGPLGSAAMGHMPLHWADVNQDLMNTYANQAMLEQMAAQPAFSGGSPSETYLSDGHLEVRSIPSSSSDHGWNIVDHHHSHSHSHSGGIIFNPEQTLHPRTFSDSSNSDGEQPSRTSFDSYIDLSIVSNAGSSPSTSSAHDVDGSSDQGYYPDHERHSPTTATITTAVAKPIAIRHEAGPSVPTISPPVGRSPTSPTSRKAGKKAILGKTTSSKIARRSPQAPRAGDSEKRVGRRKGPLRPEQRKQASEIRKLGACIRCRFLKKTCDKGDPCGGCKPSHARLWLVPCTRIDIKDLGYFLKDWRADYQRHVSAGFSVGNIIDFSEDEIPLYITHGYGHYLPLQAREVYVRDDSVFGVNWVESRFGLPTDHEVDTARLSAGVEGVAADKLSEYLDRHIDHTFEYFVDEFFEGTPFITQILKTAYRFWTREKIPVIRKALKLVLAYNLTQAVCFVKVIGDEAEYMDGLVEDDDSYYKGQTAAPVMINFQVKCAMAKMWRELQKEILEELSVLYSSVYSRDKLKHWPTIFMLAAILLAIWEEMQFDCHYRIPDTAAVEKFCNDMESTPVGVIVGLFSAISQKVPAFSEWETRKHHHMLGSNEAVCTAMEEVRDHIYRHEQYLRTRSNAKFDREDFDCLSNKFVSKLVIRAH